MWPMAYMTVPGLRRRPLWLKTFRHQKVLPTANSALLAGQPGATKVTFSLSLPIKQTINGFSNAESACCHSDVLPNSCHVHVVHERHKLQRYRPNKMSQHCDGKQGES